MAIQWTQQSLTVSDVKEVIVTDVAQDRETGQYIREVRIFGGDDQPEPPILDINQEPAKGRLLVTLRLTTQSRERIHIVVPSLFF